MCAAVAGVAVTGQSEVATSNEAERGFRGAVLGLPGAVLSSASPIVLGEPVEPGKLQAGGGRLIEGSLASEAASLEQAKAALKDVQNHYQSGVELAARLGQAAKDFSAQISPSLNEVTKAITSCSEMRSELSGEARQKFETALSTAARGGPLSSTLSNAQNTFEQLHTHADLYIDALRNCVEPRLSGLAIDDDSRAMIDSSLSGLTTALKGAGLKTENASNQKRMAELSQQLHATIDDANGLIDPHAVNAIKESFSKYFEVAGTRLKGWDVFCEHLDRLAGAAESMNGEYAAAVAALHSIGGTVREKPAYPIENVGAGGTVSTSALSSESLAEMGITTPDTNAPDVVEMNRLLRKAAHAAQGLPPPPADFVEDDRVEKLEKSPPTHLATRGDVRITTVEYRRGEELVGRDIVLSNTRLNTAITLRADFDQFWNLDEKETGMRRDASSREYGRSEAAMAFTKFESALGKLPNASREELKSLFERMGMAGNYASECPFHILDRQDERWADASFVIRNSSPGLNDREWHSTQHRLRPEHLAAFIDGEVRYRFESRAESRSPGQTLQWLEMRVQADGQYEISLKVEQGRGYSGTMTVRGGDLMRDSRDVGNTLQRYQSILAEEDGTAKLIADVARNKIVQARNVDIGDRSRSIKVVMDTHSELTDVRLTGKEVRLETAFMLPEQQAKLSAQNIPSTVATSVSIVATKVQLDLNSAFLTNLKIDTSAETSGTLSGCHLRRCSIEGENTSLSFKGRNNLELCSRSRMGFGSRVIPEAAY